MDETTANIYNTLMWIALYVLSVFYVGAVWSKVKSSFKPKEKPEWLESLQGESPLLSNSQCSFIADIRSRIMHKQQDEVNISDDQIPEIKQNASDLINGFQLVVQHLNKNPSSRQRFKEKYPQWLSCREKNITHLRNIANLIDKDNQKCQISKVIGSSVSLIGGGISLFAGRAVELLVGSILKGVGSFISAGTIIFEKKWFKDNIKKAKEIIQQDKKNMVNLVAYLDDCKRLHEALDNIKSVNNKENLLTTAEKLQNVSKKNLSRRKQEKEIEKTLKSLDIHPEVKKEISDIVGLLVAASMLYERYYPDFNLALESYKLMSLLNLSLNYFRGSHVDMNAVDNFNKNGGLTEVQKKIVMLEMALDAANIIVIAMQDSKRVESRKIRKVAAKLEKEADEFKGLYKKMKSLDIPAH